jgi:hypothetical protein
MTRDALPNLALKPHDKAVLFVSLAQMSPDPKKR